MSAVNGHEGVGVLGVKSHCQRPRVVPHETHLGIEVLRDRLQALGHTQFGSVADLELVHAQFFVVVDNAEVGGVADL